MLKIYRQLLLKQFNFPLYAIALIIFAVSLLSVGNVFVGHLHAANKNIIYAKVIGISDGDTITVLTESNTQLKVRLASIDAPERSQDFGMKSRQYLANQIFGKTITIKTRGLDKYQRTFGIIFLEDQDINELMINHGYAWFYRRYINAQPQEEYFRYDAAEESAKSQKLGLWEAPNPIPPWEYRHPAKK